jgi:hypothetical protein
MMARIYQGTLSSYMCGKRASHPTPPPPQPPHHSPPTAGGSEQQAPGVAWMLAAGTPEEGALLPGMTALHVARAGGRMSWLRWLELATMPSCPPLGEAGRPNTQLQMHHTQRLRRRLSNCHRGTVTHSSE